METIPTETKAVSAEKAALALFKRKLSLPDIETEMLKVDQVEMPVTHNFADGVYVRELFIPAGTIVLGKRHRFETCNILLKGELSLYMGPGLPAKKIKAPCIFNSKPFVKKLAYAHKDTIFLNVHPTNETDLDVIESVFIIPEEEYSKKIEGGEVCHG